jgi:acetyl esterase/lipase
VDQIPIPDQYSQDAARHLRNQLGERGLEEVGGDKWWTWRKNEADLRADWIEMQKDYNARGQEKSNRILLYLHGGAYYFGSADEHRYQIQRHARKLKARAFAPRYRLAPQFPFPCGLHDCLTAYLYLLQEYDPKSILISGDSAGGGMTAALLVLLRDQGIPLPAGAMLLSPWLDLTHSFPSILGDGKLDYIPIHGFIHRPSLSWPPAPIQSYPTPADDLKEGVPSQLPIRPDWIPSHVPDHRVMPVVELDGKEIVIKEQIQLYTPNHLLHHPLVSPITNASLGGLPPLLIQVGGGELISDEQVYFAHKAANPADFPASEENLDRWDPNREAVHKYPPTKVHLQVWNDVCHVPHTLAWTKPAKYMYRSVAQFGAWALARAQHTAIDIDDEEDLTSNSGDDDDKSLHAPGPERGLTETQTYDTDIVPRSPTDDEKTDIKPIGRTTTSNTTKSPRRRLKHQDSILYTCNQTETVGRAGDPLPPFVDNMIRQRIDRNGNVYPLGPSELFFSLKLKPNEIGVIKEAPVHRWLERKEKWHHLFAKLEPKVHAKRAKYELGGLPAGMEGEHPPPTAIIRRWNGESRKKPVTEGKQNTILGLKWWAAWGSKQDAEQVCIPSVTLIISNCHQIKNHAPPQSHAPTPAIATPAIPTPTILTPAAAASPAIDMTATEDPLALGKTETRWPSSPPRSITGRRKSVQVTDEGQADEAAITSRPPSRPTSTEFSSRSEIPRHPFLAPQYSSLQVPTVGATGRASSSVVSIKSGTVGGGHVTEQVDDSRPVTERFHSANGTLTKDEAAI